MISRRKIFAALSALGLGGLAAAAVSRKTPLLEAGKIKIFRGDPVKRLNTGYIAQWSEPPPLPAVFSGDESPEFKAIYRAMRAFLDNPGEGIWDSHALVVAAYVALKDKHGDKAHELLAAAAIYHGSADAVRAFEKAIAAWHDMDRWLKEEGVS